MPRLEGIEVLNMITILIVFMAASVVITMTGKAICIAFPPDNKEAKYEKRN